MKKIVFIILAITLYGCSKKYCSFVNDNKNTLSELITLIEKNPTEFFNTQPEPRVYYTHNYQKEEAEFKKTKSSKNIDVEDYKSFKRIFSDLSIEKILIYDNKNLLFKVNKVDFFVSDYSFYLAYLKDKSSIEIEQSFDIVEFEKCENDWYYMLERNSVAD